MRFHVHQSLAMVAALVLLAPATVPAGDAPEPLLDRTAQRHLHDALWCMNMTEQDFAFEKDHGEPLWALSNVSRLLGQPLELTALADRCRAGLPAAPAEVVWTLAGDLLEAPHERIVFTAPDVLPDMPWASLHPALSYGLTRFVLVVEQAERLLTEAFGPLHRNEAEYAAGSLLAGLLQPEVRPSARELMEATGISPEIMATLLEEAGALDPEPAAGRLLELTGRINLSALLGAAAMLEEAVSELRTSLADFDAWPDERSVLPTPFGDVVLGTKGDDAYEEPALLILEPGGDDRYGPGPGVANGLGGLRMAAIIDMAGEDLYRGSGLLGPGAALYGLCVLQDLAGNDIYECDYAGQGAAVLGAAWVEDQAGNDSYVAYGLAQGAALWGVACLRDLAGHDRYDVGLLGQAFAGPRGVGLLLEGSGNDVYVAGGREADYERHDDRYASLAQGASIGARPLLGGGVALLADAQGNDSYLADIYGQGVGYWYALGMLLDGQGHDSYRLHQYGQGAGIHLSLGLLADDGGNDSYQGYILTQGAGHDYAVGMLFDRNGDDTYTADHHAQGRAINNAVGLLVDREGTDAYFGRQPDQCQGVGNDGGNREYGSLAVLMDLAGRDRYSCGAEDGARLLRPDFGVVYDYEPDPKDPGVAAPPGPPEAAE